MPTLVQVSFRHVAPSRPLERLVHELAAKLDTFARRLGRCRVVLGPANRGPRPDLRYEVRLDLGVPGGAVVATSRPADARALPGAVRDVFAAARRQVEDYVRRRRGQVKVHAT